MPWVCARSDVFCSCLASFGESGAKAGLGWHLVKSGGGVAFGGWNPGLDVLRVWRGMLGDVWRCLLVSEGVGGGVYWCFGAFWVCIWSGET